MRNVFETLLGEAKPSLNSCPACPVKGACVFVTPGYEPGYCLHEYKLLHAFLANRLREHPPAGAAGFSSLAREVSEYAESVRRERPYDPASPQLELGWGFPFGSAARGFQATLGRFGVPAW